MRRKGFYYTDSQKPETMTDPKRQELELLETLEEMDKPIDVERLPGDRVKVKGVIYDRKAFLKAIQEIVKENESR